jgi:phytoene synthase
VRVPAVDETSAHGAVVRAAARAGEPDRYLAALLAPAAVRADLVALAAFAGEVGRVPFATRREPRLGEVRLQWWRESLARPGSERTGNPVADAVRAAMARHRLPLVLVEAVVEAARDQLNPRAFADDAALLANLERGQGALFTLAGLILLPAAAALVQTYRAAGAAYGLARLLYELPLSLGTGRVLLPLARLAAAGVDLERALAAGEVAGLDRVVADLARAARLRLGEARGGLWAGPRAARVGFLPLALVEPYLRAASGGGARRERVALSPLSRIAKIAAAHWLTGP